jgi:ribosomal protein L37AE/L43A
MDSDGILEPNGRWTCTMCERAMHIGAKESHLGGKAHIRKVAELPTLDIHTNVVGAISLFKSSCYVGTNEIFPLGAVDMFSVTFGMPYFSAGTWTCTTCDRTMVISTKQQHLNGKPHLNKLAAHENTSAQARIESVCAAGAPESSAQSIRVLSSKIVFLPALYKQSLQHPVIAAVR